MDVNVTVKLQFDQEQLSIKLLLSSEEDKKDSREEEKSRLEGNPCQLSPALLAVTQSSVLFVT